MLFDHHRQGGAKRKDESGDRIHEQPFTPMFCISLQILVKKRSASLPAVGAPFSGQIKPPVILPLLTRYSTYIQ